MKKLLLLLLFLCFSAGTFAQPDEIKRIMAKQKAGEELTEQEEVTFEKWLDDMKSKAANLKNPGSVPSQSGAKKSDCPALRTTPIKVTELTRESYVALAKGLLAAYGPKSGDLPGLKSLVETSKTPTDGADMGGAFMIAGAGSACIYVIAWSAAQKPDDILAANNLGIALKDMGDFTKALQVLRYADRIKPNIGLVLCNLGWVYREAGDYVNAKLYFDKALKAAPAMTTPYLGLGLIAKCEGNMAKAEEYLRKALADNYSAVGFAAYKQAKAAQPPKPDAGQDKPLTQEKGDAGEVEVPEMPVFDQKEKTAAQKELVADYVTRLDARTQQLIEEYQSTLSVVLKQAERAAKDPDNAIVFRRDYAKELMQIEDITDVLFGKNSIYGQSVTKGAKRLEQNSQFIEKDLPALQQHMDKSLRLQQELIKLLEEMAACGDDDICKARVQAKIDQNKYEAEQEAYQMCLLNKGEMDNSYSATCKTYREEYDAFKEAVLDLYAFTNPILERIYAPSYNELQNLHRQLLVLTHEKAVVGIGSGLPELAEKYNELKCVEPKPPEPPQTPPDDSKLPKKKEKDCPLGKGINQGFGAISFELDCEHVKLSGGEGVLWSVSRDFTKHETKVGVGVGAKAEYGNGNLTGEATVMVEVTVGQADVIKNVELTSTVKAGLGGLVEGEITGRIAMEGGPSIQTNAGFTNPGFPQMPGSE
ncbi:MAG TPA: tetratricopeptide repeat protein [Bacteroidales bacterium]|nr:tetratricopeptide repeat protein [Bacteroidales bacterium]